MATDRVTGLDQIAQNAAATAAALEESVTTSALAAVSELTPNSRIEADTHQDVSGEAILQAEHNIVTASSQPVVQIAPLVQPTPQDDFWSCAYEVGPEADNVERLTYIDSFNWAESKNAWQVLARYPMPTFLMNNNNHPAWGQMRYFRYLRAGFEFRLEMTAPFGYAGLIALVYVPPGYCSTFANQGYALDADGLDYECLFNLPYALLDIAKQTEVTLTVPYMNYTNYARMTYTNEKDAPMGAICAVNVTKLLIPANGVNNLDGAIFGAFLDLDLQCPRVPSNSNNGRRRNYPKVEGPSNYYNVPTPKAEIILPGPGAWNAANASTVAAVESLALNNDATAVDFASAGARSAERDAVDVLRRWSFVGEQAWSNSTNNGSAISFVNVDFAHGNFKHFQKHFQFWRGSIEFKAVIVAPNTAQGKLMLAWYPDNGDIAVTSANARNAVTLIQDVTGPDQTLVMPFTSMTWRRDWSQYGRITAVCVNKFKPSTASASECRIVWLMRAGSDFRLFCPKHPDKALHWKNRPQTKNEGFQDPLTDTSEPASFLNFKLAEVDIQSQSHSLLASYFGRASYYATIDPNSAAQRITLGFPLQTHFSLAYFYAYWSGELIVTIQTTRDPVIATHSYTDLGTNLSLQVLTSNGAIFVPRFTAKSFSCPFYSKTPLRSIYDNPPLGYLYVNSPGTAYVYIQLRNPNFFVKVSPPYYDVSAKLFAPVQVTHQGRINQLKLMQAGDVEQNPGPILVYQDRGLYKHYGVLHAGKVFNLNASNLLSSLVSGKAEIIVSDYDETWYKAGPEVCTMAQKYLDAGVFEDLQYSIDNNCETWARDLLGDTTRTQSQNLKIGLAMVACLMFVGLAATHSDQAGWGSSITAFIAKLTDLVYGGFQAFVVRTTVKTVCRIICYLIMYCHSPNLLTTGTLAALIAMDCTNTELDEQTKKIVSALLDGRFRDFCREMCKTAGEDLDPPNIDDQQLAQNLSDQGPAKEFNDWSNAAKNVQWWFEKLTAAFDWIKNKLFPPDTAEMVDELEEFKSEIATTMACADEHLVLMMTDKTYSISSAAKEKHMVLADMLSSIVLRLTEIPKAGQLLTRCSHLLTRFQQVNFEPVLDWVVRPEPLGIWISGAAGAGKSFLVAKLTAAVAKHFGWRCYSNPTGSRHMDGYTDQQIHVFDDFGQCKDEEDYNLICQLISSCPYIVPKADVTAKGTQYQARLVVVTTNRHDFSSHKLFDTEALKRRFPVILSIRPKEQVSTNGYLDVSLAARTGSLAQGACWQRDLAVNAISTSHNWQDLDFKVLVEEVIKEIETRSQVVKLVNQGPPAMDRLKEKTQAAYEKFKQKAENKLRKSLFVNLEEPSSFFDSDKLARTSRVLIAGPPKSMYEKCKLLVDEAIRSLKKFLDRNRTWILAIGALGSVISIASALIPWARRKDQSVYDGRAPVRLTRDFQRLAEQHLANQGRVNFDPVLSHMVNVSWKGVISTALAIGPKEVITYGHDDFDAVILPNGSEVPVSASFDVTYDGKPMDLQILTFSAGTQLKSLRRLIYDKDYRGKGFLLWKEKNSNYIQPVTDIQPYNNITTREGTKTSFGYVYNCPTTKGSCGGVLVAPIGGNLRILGIHTSGSGETGCANRLFTWFQNEGRVTMVKVHDRPLYHQPRKTAYKPSPFYQHPMVEPAPLSIHDGRLEVEVDDLVIKAAQKYIGNTFNPPPICFAAAANKVADMLATRVRVSGCMDFYTATSSEVMPIDWQTSPGLKYLGHTKRELVEQAFFHQDVMAILEEPETTFVTYLKDELRPVEKVRAGKVRAIEACPFDFVIAFRMVMGSIYNQIYRDQDCRTGIAVGICPITHFGTMMLHLKDNCLCLDFSGFDGSLPPELLRAGVEVMSRFHEEPELVKKIHEPVINSHHLVNNQEWWVEGGMCSGAPCTSVLNSVCNNIAAICVAISCGADLDGLYVVSYGDDIILSSEKKFDLSLMQDYYKKFFGMTCTAADKTDNFNWVTKDQISFLKRTPQKLAFYDFPVGKLDLQSMMDKIQWTKGAFNQQLDSFAFELAVHGKTTYDAVRTHCLKVCPTVNFPSYEQAVAKVKFLLTNQGKTNAVAVLGKNLDTALALDLALHNNDDGFHTLDIQGTLGAFALRVNLRGCEPETSQEAEDLWVDGEAMAGPSSLMENAVDELELEAEHEPPEPDMPCVSMDPHESWNALVDFLVSQITFGKVDEPDVQICHRSMAIDFTKNFNQCVSSEQRVHVLQVLPDSLDQAWSIVVERERGNKAEPEMPYTI
nr:MAG: polyprotein [Picornaviridae sp.]